MSDPEAVGRRLRTVRLSGGMTQMQLARPELSDSYISLIESGKRTPTAAVIDLLARKLGCPTSYLLTGVSPQVAEELEMAVSYARIALDNGEVAQARGRFAAVLTHPALGELPALAHQARWGHALALEATGALDQAIDELRPIAGSVSPSDEPDHFAEVHIALCRCLRERGELTESIQVGENALDQITVAGEGWTDSMVMLGATVLAAYEQRGDLTYADLLATKLITHAKDIGSPRALMAAYWNAAWVAEARGDPHHALTLAQRAIALLGEEDDPRNLPRLRMTYAHFLLAAQPDQAAHARDILAQAEHEVATSAANPIDTAWCLTDQAHAETVLDNPDQAASLATHAIDLLHNTPGLALADAYTVLARAHMQLGQREQAITALTRAATALQHMGATRPAARAWYRLADLFGAVGKTDQETAALRHALHCAGL